MSYQVIICFMLQDNSNPLISQTSQPSQSLSQKNFLNTLTLYKHYTNDTGRANDKRTLTEV